MAYTIEAPGFGFAPDFLRESCGHMQEKELLAAMNPNSEIECETDRYKVMLNIKPFNVEEISVRVADNNCIKIQAQHQPKSDDLNNSTGSEDSSSSPPSSFSQSFHLPSDAEMKLIKCDLSNDGIFTIVAPRRYSIPEGTGMVDFPMLQL